MIDSKTILDLLKKQREINDAQATVNREFLDAIKQHSEVNKTQIEINQMTQNRLDAIEELHQKS